MQKDFSHKQNTHSLRKLSEKDFITTHWKGDTLII